MVMALFVLIGFGLLFTFAFDEGFQGGISLESEIKAKTAEIESTKERITYGTETLKSSPARNSAEKELRRMNVEIKTRSNEIANLKSDVQALGTEIAEGNQKWEAYKDQYREFARGKAKGQVLDKLETRSGGVFKNVNIREVTAVGIQIRHDEGQKRIPFEDLPADIQDLYQFDPSQKAKALAAENTERNQLEAAVAVVNEQVDAKMVEQRKIEAAAAAEKLGREIVEKQAEVDSLQSEIEGLEQEIVRAAEAANAARQAGRMHLSKSGSINGKIRHRKSRIATLEAEIRQMRARL